MEWALGVGVAFLGALAGIVYVGGRDERARRRAAEAWFVAKRQAPTVTPDELPGVVASGRGRAGPVEMTGRLTGTPRESPLSGAPVLYYALTAVPIGFPWREPVWQDAYTAPNLALEAEGERIPLRGALNVATPPLWSRSDFEAARALLRSEGLSPADHQVSGATLEPGAEVRVVGLVEEDPDRTALRADGYRGGVARTYRFVSDELTGRRLEVSPGGEESAPEPSGH